MKLRTITFILTLLVSTATIAEPFAHSVNSDGPDSNTSDNLYEIDLADGSVQAIGKVRPFDPLINSDIEGLAFDENGVLYGVDDADETLLSINIGTGLATSVTGTAFNLQLNAGTVYDFGMTFTCDNTILVTSDQTQTLYRAEVGSPQVEVIGGANSLTLPITGIAAWGENVYGIGQGVDESQQTLIPNLYSINTDNGTASFIGPLSDSFVVAPYTDAGLAFDAEGNLWAMTDRSDFQAGSELVRIDITSGAALEVMQVDVIGFESLAITSPGGCEEPLPPVVSPRGVPATGNIGLLLLSLILAMVGLLQVRRYN